MRKQHLTLFSVAVIATLILAACRTPTPVVQTQVVRETQIVLETQVVRETQIVRET